MLSGIRAIVNEYAIPVLLNVGLVVLFFGDLDVCKASEIADVLLFMSPRFLLNKISSLTLF